MDRDRGYANEMHAEQYRAFRQMQNGKLIVLHFFFSFVVLGYNACVFAYGQTGEFSCCECSYLSSDVVLDRLFFVSFCYCHPSMLAYQEVEKHSR